MADTEDAAETPASKYNAKYWEEKLGDYKREIDSKWKTQRDNLDKLYSRDERADSADREYSIFWANIEVLKAAVYSRPPTPVVVPRFKDGNDVARAASDILERCLTTTFEQSDIDGCMKEVRDEFLRYARGTARVRLSTRNGTPCVEYDHFTAADFAHDTARTWRECDWLAFRAWLNKDQLTARFAEPMQAKGLSIDSIPRKKRDPNSAASNPEDQAPVWEIWCKTSRKVHFYAEDFGYLLDETDPWIDLSSFWPCPKPAYGTLVPGKLRPVPDIRQYKDQIEEINEYTARIAALSESLRIRGFYPAGSAEIGDAIEAAMKNTDQRQVLIPVSSFAALGGTAFKDNIVWIPLDQIVSTIQALIELRRVVIEDVYQITGISDIIRGQTEASETATAQKIKAQWGSVRIQERQGELARFARDLTRISGEIMAENFDPQTIAEMSQVQLPQLAQKQQAQQQMQMAAQQAQMTGQTPPAPPPEMQKMMDSPAFEEVVQFLADDKARGFLIDIETDSTIQPDEDAEKQRRTEFVQTIGSFMEQSLPAIQAMPQLAPFIGETLKFLASAFRAGRPLEGSIDQLVEEIDAIASQPKQAPPVPPDVQARAEAEQARGQQIIQKGQQDQQKHQQDMALDQQKFVLDAKLKMLDKGLPIDGDLSHMLAGAPAQNNLESQVVPLLQQLTQYIKMAAAPKKAQKLPDGTWVSEPVTMQ